MAKYDITYSCRHNGTVDLVGKHTDREQKIAWYEQTAVCPECYKAQQLKAAEAKTASLGLPELDGSEKQVAWANTLRLRMIPIIEDTISGLSRGRATSPIEAKLAELGRDGLVSELVANAKAKGATGDQISAAKKSLINLLDEIARLNTLKTTTSAKWIIDNRI